MIDFLVEILIGMLTISFIVVVTMGLIISLALLVVKSLRDRRNLKKEMER